MDIHKCIHKLNIKKYYALNPIERVVSYRGHTEPRNKSVFNPKIVNNKYVDMFKMLVMADLEK